MWNGYHQPGAPAPLYHVGYDVTEMPAIPAPMYSQPIQPIPVYRPSLVQPSVIYPPPAQPVGYMQHQQLSYNVSTYTSHIPRAYTPPSFTPPSYTPPTSFTPPGASYTPPPGLFPERIATYTPPAVYTPPPAPTFTPPAQTFTPPTQTFIPNPTSLPFTPAERTFTPPDRTFTPPERTFTPPERTFTPQSSVTFRNPTSPQVKKTDPPQVTVKRTRHSSLVTYKYPEDTIGSNQQHSADALTGQNIYSLPNVPYNYSKTNVNETGDNNHQIPYVSEPEPIHLSLDYPTPVWPTFQDFHEPGSILSSGTPLSDIPLPDLPFGSSQGSLDWSLDKTADLETHLSAPNMSSTSPESTLAALPLYRVFGELLKQYDSLYVTDPAMQQTHDSLAASDRELIAQAGGLRSFLIRSQYFKLERNRVVLAAPLPPVGQIAQLPSKSDTLDMETETRLYNEFAGILYKHGPLEQTDSAIMAHILKMTDSDRVYMKRFGSSLAEFLRCNEMFDVNGDFITLVDNKYFHDKYGGKTDDKSPSKSNLQSSVNDPSKSNQKSASSLSTRKSPKLESDTKSRGRGRTRCSSGISVANYTKIGDTVDDTNNTIGKDTKRFSRTKSGDENLRFSKFEKPFKPNTSPSAVGSRILGSRGRGSWFKKEASPSAAVHPASSETIRKSPPGAYVSNSPGAYQNNGRYRENIPFSPIDNTPVPKFVIPKMSENKTNNASNDKVDLNPRAIIFRPSSLDLSKAVPFGAEIITNIDEPISNISDVSCKENTQTDVTVKGYVSQVKNNSESDINNATAQSNIIEAQCDDILTRCKNNADFDDNVSTTSEPIPNLHSSSFQLSDNMEKSTSESALRVNLSKTEIIDSKTRSDSCVERYISKIEHNSAKEPKHAPTTTKVNRGKHNFLDNASAFFSNFLELDTSPVEDVDSNVLDDKNVSKNIFGNKDNEEKSLNDKNDGIESVDTHNFTPIKSVDPTVENALQSLQVESNNMENFTSGSFDIVSGNVRTENLSSEWDRFISDHPFVENVSAKDNQKSPSDWNSTKSDTSPIEGISNVSFNKTDALNADHVDDDVNSAQKNRTKHDWLESSGSFCMSFESSCSDERFGTDSDKKEDKPDNLNPVNYDDGKNDATAEINIETTAITSPTTPEQPAAHNEMKNDINTEDTQHGDVINDIDCNDIGNQDTSKKSSLETNTTSHYVDPRNNMDDVTQISNFQNNTKDTDNLEESEENCDSFDIDYKDIEKRPKESATSETNIIAPDISCDKDTEVNTFPNEDASVATNVETTSNSIEFYSDKADSIPKTLDHNTKNDKDIEGVNHSEFAISYGYDHRGDSVDEKAVADENATGKSKHDDTNLEDADVGKCDIDSTDIIGGSEFTAEDTSQTNVSEFDIDYKDIEKSTNEDTTPDMNVTIDAMISKNLEFCTSIGDTIDQIPLDDTKKENSQKDINLNKSDISYDINYKDIDEDVRKGAISRASISTSISFESNTSEIIDEFGFDGEKKNEDMLNRADTTSKMSLESYTSDADEKITLGDVKNEETVQDSEKLTDRDLNITVESKNTTINLEDASVDVCDGVIDEEDHAASADVMKCDDIKKFDDIEKCEEVEKCDDGNVNNLTLGKLNDILTKLREIPIESEGSVEEVFSLLSEVVDETVLNEVVTSLTDYTKDTVTKAVEKSEIWNKMQAISTSSREFVKIKYRKRSLEREIDNVQQKYDEISTGKCGDYKEKLFDVQHCMRKIRHELKELHKDSERTVSELNAYKTPSTSETVDYVPERMHTPIEGNNAEIEDTFNSTTGGNNQEFTQDDIAAKSLLLRSECKSEDSPPMDQLSVKRNLAKNVPIFKDRSSPVFERNIVMPKRQIEPTVKAKFVNKNDDDFKFVGGSEVSGDVGHKPRGRKRGGKNRKPDFKRTDAKKKIKQNDVSPPVDDDVTPPVRDVSRLSTSTSDGGEGEKRPRKLRSKNSRLGISKTRKSDSNRTAESSDLDISKSDERGEACIDVLVAATKRETHADEVPDSLDKLQTKSSLVSADVCNVVKKISRRTKIPDDTTEKSSEDILQHGQSLQTNLDTNTHSEDSPHLSITRDQKLLLNIDKSTMKPSDIDQNVVHPSPKQQGRSPTYLMPTSPSGTHYGHSDAMSASLPRALQAENALLIMEQKVTEIMTQHQLQQLSTTANFMEHDMYVQMHTALNNQLLQSKKLLEENRHSLLSGADIKSLLSRDTLTLLQQHQLYTLHPLLQPHDSATKDSSDIDDREEDFDNNEAAKKIRTNAAKTIAKPLTKSAKLKSGYLSRQRRNRLSKPRLNIASVSVNIDASTFLNKSDNSAKSDHSIYESNDESIIKSVHSSQKESSASFVESHSSFFGASEKDRSLPAEIPLGNDVTKTVSSEVNTVNFGMKNVKVSFCDDVTPESFLSDSCKPSMASTPTAEFEQELSHDLSVYTEKVNQKDRCDDETKNTSNKKDDSLTWPQEVANENANSQSLINDRERENASNQADLPSHVKVIPNENASSHTISPDKTHVTSTGTTTSRVIDNNQNIETESMSLPGSNSQSDGPVLSTYSASTDEAIHVAQGTNTVTTSVSTTPLQHDVKPQEINSRIVPSVPTNQHLAEACSQKSSDNDLSQSQETNALPQATVDPPKPQLSELEQMVMARILKAHPNMKKNPDDLMLLVKKQTDLLKQYKAQKRAKQGSASPVTTAQSPVSTATLPLMSTSNNSQSSVPTSPQRVADTLKNAAANLQMTSTQCVQTPTPFPSTYFMSIPSQNVSTLQSVSSLSTLNRFDTTQSSFVFSTPQNVSIPNQFMSTANQFTSQPSHLFSVTQNVTPQNQFVSGSSQVSTMSSTSAHVTSPSQVPHQNQQSNQFISSNLSLPTQFVSTTSQFPAPPLHQFISTLPSTQIVSSPTKFGPPPSSAIFVQIPQLTPSTSIQSQSQIQPLSNSLPPQSSFVPPQQSSFLPSQSTHAPTSTSFAQQSLPLRLPTPVVVSNQTPFIPSRPINSQMPVISNQPINTSQMPQEIQANFPSSPKGSSSSLTGQSLFMGQNSFTGPNNNQFQPQQTPNRPQFKPNLPQVNANQHPFSVNQLIKHPNQPQNLQNQPPNLQNQSMNLPNQFMNSITHPMNPSNQHQNPPNQPMNPSNQPVNPPNQPMNPPSQPMNPPNQDMNPLNQPINQTVNHSNQLPNQPMPPQTQHISPNQSIPAPNQPMLPQNQHMPPPNQHMPPPNQALIHPNQRMNPPNPFFGNQPPNRLQFPQNPLPSPNTLPPGINQMNNQRFPNPNFNPNPRGMPPTPFMNLLQNMPNMPMFANRFPAMPPVRPPHPMNLNFNRQMISPGIPRMGPISPHMPVPTQPPRSSPPIRPPPGLAPRPPLNFGSNFATPAPPTINFNCNVTTASSTQLFSQLSQQATEAVQPPDIIPVTNQLPVTSMTSQTSTESTPFHPLTEAQVESMPSQPVTESSSSELLNPVSSHSSSWLDLDNDNWSPTFSEAVTTVTPSSSTTSITEVPSRAKLSKKSQSLANSVQPVATTSTSIVITTASSQMSKTTTVSSSKQNDNSQAVSTKRKRAPTQNTQTSDVPKETVKPSPQKTDTQTKTDISQKNKTINDNEQSYMDDLPPRFRRQNQPSKQNQGPTQNQPPKKQEPQKAKYVPMPLPIVTYPSQSKPYVNKYPLQSEGPSKPSNSRPALTPSPSSDMTSFNLPSKKSASLTPPPASEDGTNRKKTSPISDLTAIALPPVTCSGSDKSQHSDGHSDSGPWQEVMSKRKQREPPPETSQKTRRKSESEKRKRTGDQALYSVRLKHITTASQQPTQHVPNMTLLSQFSAKPVLAQSYQNQLPAYMTAKSRQSSHVAVSKTPSTFASTPQLQTIGDYMVMSRPANPDNNYEKLIGKLNDTYSYLNRSQVIEMVSRIRDKRGSLSGLSFNRILSETRTLIANNPQRYGNAEGGRSMVSVGSSEVLWDDECSICCEPFSLSSAGDIKTIDCGHYFHDECIKKWVYNHDSTCPICRRLTLFHEDYPKLS